MHRLERQSVRVRVFNGCRRSDVVSRDGRAGQLLSSWELARRYGFTDYDGRRPDWGRLAIDWSVLPPPMVQLFRTGTDLQLAWLTALASRTRRFRRKLPTV